MSPEPKTAVAIWGASGRMGSELLRLIQGAADLKLAQAVVSPQSHRLGQPASGSIRFTAPEAIEPGVRVVIDFSTPAALLRLVQMAAEARCPLVSGTTGIESGDLGRIQEASARIPVFWAPNFSLGVAALAAALRAVLPLLDGFEVELVETHHGAKKDAPSGTALRLLDEVRRLRGEPTRLVHGRHGLDPRTTGEIGVHALRGGANPGRHEVHLLGRSEDLVLCHQAYSREVFALGALRAARFVLTAPPGRYGMEQLLSKLVASRTG
jgi:4-hydroxy-tetrahydrodipicolinate reductase